jgi:hypothetical protein
MHCFFLQFEINLKLYCTVHTVYHVHLPSMVLEKGKQFMGMGENESEIEGLENM